MNTTVAPSIALPQVELPEGLRARNDREGFMPCAVCGKGVREEGHKLWVWVHGGGSIVVTAEEGARLGDRGDMGLHPVGRDCLKRFPALKDYLQKAPE